MSEKASDHTIEEVLRFMCIDQDSGKRYDHLRRFLAFAKQHSGEEWKTVQSMMYSSVGVGKRYLDEYADCCDAWGTVVRRNNNKIYYVGIPKGKTPPPKGKPFTDYPEPPEHVEKVGGESK